MFKAGSVTGLVTVLDQFALSPVLADEAPSGRLAAEAADLDWLKQPVRTMAARMAILLRTAAWRFIDGSLAGKSPA
jgi:hypothetical protein